MNTSLLCKCELAPSGAACENGRLDHLDAVRAFALILGIVFHASLSFFPIFIGWAVMDVSTSSLVANFMLISHSFRMPLFFLIAGYFAHLAFHRRGPIAYLKSRFTRIVIPFALGWFALRPLLVSGWIMGNASLRGDVDIWAGMSGGFASLATLSSGLFIGTHLWFLYYLSLVTVVVLALRYLVSARRSWRERTTSVADAALVSLASGRFGIGGLIAPTALAVWYMNGWGVDTPDRSLALHIPALALYGFFFGIGWMLRRNPKSLARLTPLSLVRVAICIGSVVATTLLSRFQMEPSHPQFALARAAFVACYATMMWTFVLLSIGIAERLCRRPNAVVRYVADSSYWMYLIHLPVVVWLQVAVAELPFHWSMKLAAVSAVTIAFALLTYDLFVRSTFIGKLLNGRRRERAIFAAPPKVGRA